MRLYTTLSLLLVVGATISPKKKTKSADDDDDGPIRKVHEKPKKPKTAEQLAPGSESVFDRGLVKEDMTYREILRHHAAYNKEGMKSRSWSGGETLVYVTPWNNHGYDVAKWFHKFTLVAPVWLQLKTESIGIKVTGTHDVDAGWMEEVRQTGAKVVPRVIFEINLHTLKQLLADEDSIKTITATLLDTVLEHRLDGLVIEVWNSISTEMADDVVHLMTHLADALHGNDKLLILVIPPTKEDARDAQFTHKHFEKLKDVVDFFSLMTYDYFGKMGAFNAPLPWVESSVNALTEEGGYRRKILVGMNFYGRYIPNIKQQGVQHLLGRDFVKKMPELVPDLDEKLSWHAEAREHFVLFQDRATDSQSVIIYPTIKSIHERLVLAERLGCGVSIWEIGQGLDYFYDLF